MSLFCRHNRFLADCAICSKDTVLDPARGAGARRAQTTKRSARSGRSEKAPQQAFTGPHSSVGPYEDADGMRYEVRLERVPGGVRLAEWSGSRLRPRAPVLRTSDLPSLLEGAAGALAARDAEALIAALGREAAAEPSGAAGVSKGRSGDFKEELRAEAMPEGRLRVARWVLRPGTGWQLQDAPPMLPAARFAEAIGHAVAEGLAVSGRPAAARL